MLHRLPLALLGIISLSATTLPLHAAPAEMSSDIIVVETNNKQNLVFLGGTVVPAREVTIAAQMPGRVEYIAGVEGDSFATSTVLVALDDDDLLAQRRAAWAALVNADAALRNAGVQYTRELVNPGSDRTMQGMGVPSMFDSMFTKGASNMMGTRSSGMDRHADLMNRSAGIQQARSALDQARSRLEEIDAKLRDTVGKAPFDGVILKKLVEVGDTVQPGMPLLKFADTSKLQVQVEVPARLMFGVREGDVFDARLDVNKDETLRVVVAQIFPMADPVRHTVTVKLDLPAHAQAGPGMYSEVMIPDVNSPTQTLPVVPLAALVWRGSLPAVYVLTDRGDTELRVLRIGDKDGKGNVVVLSGLHGGERIINRPNANMRSADGFR